MHTFTHTRQVEIQHTGNSTYPEMNMTSELEVTEMTAMAGMEQSQLASTKADTVYAPLVRSRRKYARSSMKKGRTATDINTRNAATKKTTAVRLAMDCAVRFSPKFKYMRPVIRLSIVYIAKRTQ
jgi:hypothetical protein